MTAKELFGRATSLLSYRRAIDQLGFPVMAAPDRAAIECGFNLADYIFATVKPDDDEPMDDEWLRGVWFPDMLKDGIHGPVEKLRVKLALFRPGCVNYVGERKTLIDNITRGEFRALCRLLRIALPEEKQQS